MLASAVLMLAGLASLSTAGYVLEDDYEPASFFSMFDFFTGRDPTNGYVTYVDQTTAQNDGLINVQNGAAYMGVDHTNDAAGSGRASVRVTSQKSYNHGLVILDLAHMPGGICGTWPAFWLVGPNWPSGGEIDIIEGVNSQASNDMTLHTGPGCSISNNGMFSGSITTPNCYVNAPGQSTNAGCQITTPNPQSYGAGFNANGGGVYATEWTSQHINIYFFPRSSIPGDVASGIPDPSTWGTALASFSSSGGNGVDFDTFFTNQQIVFDTTFCGDWAGNVWSGDATCAPKAATCQAFVQNNPSAFTDAYWSVNSLKVYQSNGAAATTASTPVAASSTPVPIPVPVPPASTSVFGWSSASSLAGGPPASIFPHSSVSALQASVFSEPKSTAAAAAPAALVIPSAATTLAQTEPLAASPPSSSSSSSSSAAAAEAASGSAQPPQETVNALQFGAFGLDKDKEKVKAKTKAKKRERNTRHAKHLMELHHHHHRRRNFGS